MYLKEITVPIPFEQGKIVIRNEKTVQMELDREYSSETQNSRVRRRTIGKVVPLFADRMYPNENYFALVPNTVPREIRDPFLTRCAKKREIAELKKDPAAMQRRVSNGVQYLKEKGKQLSPADQNQEQKSPDEKKWYVRDHHDLAYIMQVFNDIYLLLETYTEKRPEGIFAGHKVKMINKILNELKITLKDHLIIQDLELIEEPRKVTDENGVTTLEGMSNCDVLMLLTWYKDALKA